MKETHPIFRALTVEISDSFKIFRDFVNLYEIFIDERLTI